MYDELLKGIVFVSFSMGSCLVVGHQVVILTYLSSGQNIGD